MEPELVLQLIEENRETRTTTLDLSNCGIRGIPPQLTELVWLEELILGSDAYYNVDFSHTSQKRKGPVNVFSRLPEGFGNLQNLKKLVISGNPDHVLSIENISEIARLAALQFVYISYTAVRSIAVLENLTNLEELHITDNKIRDISPVMRLPNLKVLDFGSNLITDIVSLKHLSALTDLKFSNNQIHDISPLANLTYLKKLHFSLNQVRDITVVSNFTLLEELYFSSNQVTDLAPLARLPHLQTLDFYKNQVKDISALATLSALRRLHFDFNEVADITVLGKMSSLETLSFEENLVQQIQPLMYLSALKVFRCRGCPIEDCPADVYETGDPKQLKAYFDAQEMKTTRDIPVLQIKFKKDKEDTRRDVKLIMLGNSNAGKTNLAQYLEKNQFTGKRNTTHGLEVHRWLPDEKRFPALKDIAVSIWDFGGQEYYHGAYRLFLSANAIYVLLWCRESNMNGRRKTRLHDTDETGIELEHFELQYWLDTIAHYSGGKTNAALIAVQNKTDEPDLDKQRIDQKIHEKYNIRDSFHISLKQGSQKKNIRQYNSLQHFLAELEYIIGNNADKATIPSHWQQVRNAILALKSPKKPASHFTPYIQHDLWISLADFEKACNQLLNTPLTEDEVYTLPRWLDRGGIAVYFPDIPKLQDRLFLRPDLLAARIYEVLNNEVHQLGGEFSATEIFSGKNKEMKTIFLEITLHLDLIFPHPLKAKENYFLAPQYLPDNHPIEDLFQIASKDAWEKAFWVKVPLFYYKKLLHGLLLRFASDSQTECRYFWKHGIMFIKNNLRVLIKGLYPNEDEDEGVILIGVEKDFQYQHTLQQEIFTEFLHILQERKDTSSNTAFNASQSKIKATNNPATGDSSGQEPQLPEIQLSYDGKYFVNYQDLLKNSGEAKIKASNSHTWLLTQHFAPLLPTLPPKAKRVFLSYSHQNTIWLGRLRTHLAGLRRAKEIETWDDKEILPGDLWDATIKKNLEEADVFILLLSADFIASDYIWNTELSSVFKSFEQRNAIVIPVLLEPLDLGGIQGISPTADKQSLHIGKFEIIPKNADERLQAISLWQNHEEALSKVAERIRLAIKND